MVLKLGYFTLTGRSYTKSELSELLQKCGLQADAHDKRLSEYSKGMRQKVGIAIAYAKDAQVYLLMNLQVDWIHMQAISYQLKTQHHRMASHDIFRVRESCDNWYSQAWKTFMKSSLLTLRKINWRAYI